MMTETEMRIAIAEKCGFMAIWFSADNGDYYGYKKDQETIIIPNYPRSLDAMHIAEKTLDDETADNKSLYYDYLSVFVGWPEATSPSEAKEIAHWNVVRATAPQRAEAFCRVFWPERFK